MVDSARIPISHNFVSAGDRPLADLSSRTYFHRLIMLGSGGLLPPTSVFLDKTMDTFSTPKKKTGAKRKKSTTTKVRKHFQTLKLFQHILGN